MADSASNNYYGPKTDKVIPVSPSMQAPAPSVSPPAKPVIPQPATTAPLPPPPISTTPPSLPTPQAMDEITQAASAVRPLNLISDAFEHLLLLISLSVVTTSLTYLLQYFTDKLLNTASPELSYASAYLGNVQAIILRLASAAFIIGIIAYAALYIRIARRDKTQPRYISSIWRQAVIGLWLVGPSFIVLYECGSLMYHILAWNLSTSSALHAAIVILLNVIIATYYLRQLYRRVYV